MKKIHWKSFLVGMLAVILVAALSLPVLGAGGVWQTWEVLVGGINLVVDGQTVQPVDANGNPVEVVNYNGTTYLPLRSVGKALGKEVDWDGETRTVYLGAKPAQQSGWVLIYENTEQRPDETSGMYSDSYGWEKDEVHGLMCHSHVKVANGDPYQKTEFMVTCTLPPKYGEPGGKITFDIAAVLVETNIAKYYFGDSGSVQFGGPGKGLGIAGYYLMNILDEGGSRTHPDSVGAGTGGGNTNAGESCTVYWIFPNFPQPGDRCSFYFMSFGVETEWCYEYQG